MAPSDHVVRVAVLGVSSFAEQGHIPAINAHPRARVVALFGRDLERTREIAQRTGVALAADDLAALLSRDDVDAVAVASSDDQHHPYTMAALGAGKHALCEKPMALDAVQAREMARAARQSGVVAQVAFTFRHTYCLQELRRRVLDGAIGAPHYVEVQGQRMAALPDGPRTWRDDPATHGTGQLAEMGSHYIDAVNFVLGPRWGHISAVAAVTQPIAGDRPAIGLASVLFVTEAGIPGHMLASRTTPPPVPYSAIHGGGPRGHMGYIIVSGDRGALMAVFTRGEQELLSACAPGGEWTPVELPVAAGDREPHAISRMFGAFIDAIVKGSTGEHDATFDDGVRSQAAIDAIVAASASGAWEQVDLRP